MEKSYQGEICFGFESLSIISESTLESALGSQTVFSLTCFTSFCTVGFFQHLQLEEARDNDTYSIYVSSYMKALRKILRMLSVYRYYSGLMRIWLIKNWAYRSLSSNFSMFSFPMATNFLMFGGLHYVSFGTGCFC